MAHHKLELDRLAFFSDAIVAIAITLIGTEPESRTCNTDHLTFSDIAMSCKQFLAFALPF